VSSVEYYLLWLAAGLVIAATASAVICLRMKRRLKALEMLDALNRYCEWVDAHRRAPFLALGQGADGPLDDVREIGRRWFPDLCVETRSLLAVHSRLSAFLEDQQKLWIGDAEAWLESDYDSGFAQLWRQHLAAAQVLAGKLARSPATQEPRHRPGRTYPA
jgi:hypothetical protein